MRAHVCVCAVDLWGTCVHCFCLRSISKIAEDGGDENYITAEAAAGSIKHGGSGGGAAAAGTPRKSWKSIVQKSQKERPTSWQSVRTKRLSIH